MKKLLLLLVFLPLIFSCGQNELTQEYNQVVSENLDLRNELDIKIKLIDELESENRSLKSTLEISELLLEKCNDKIYGDAFLLERRGTSGYIRLEGYEEAVEYLQECCW